MDFFALAVNFKRNLDESLCVDTYHLIGDNSTTFKHTSKNYHLSLSPIRNFFSLDKNEQGIKLYLGRDFANHEPLTNIEEATFPYLIIAIDEQHKQVTIESDSLGLYRYFIVESNDTLYITNNLHVASLFASQTKGLNYCQKSYLTLLSLGTTLPEQTLYQEVTASHPLKNITLKNNELFYVDKKPIRLEEKSITTKQIYHTFQKSVHSILKTSPIKWINLTGGLDTRLMLSTLTPKQRSHYPFFFDTFNGNTEVIPYDYTAVKEFKKRLKIHIIHEFNFPFDYNQLPRELRAGPCEYSPHNHLLTGMYGGEILGANVLNVSLEASLLETSKDDGIKKVLQAKEKWQQDFRTYLGVNHDLFYYIFNFLNAAASRIYNDRIWNHPYMLSQKKISPFINTSLIKQVLANDLHDIKDYRLYYQVADQFLGDLKHYPLHSTIGRFYPDSFDIVRKPSSLPVIISSPKQTTTSMAEAEALSRLEPPPELAHLHEKTIKNIRLY